VAQTYVDVTHYVYMARLELQDLIPPYRYADATLVRALNRGLAELSRLRPDILLDLKYQSPFRKGDIGDGIPGGYTPADIGHDTDGQYLEGAGTPVPIPSKYLRGEDSLLSTVQMPKGIPVATVAIGPSGAANAGLLAVSILALSRPALRAKLQEYRAILAADVLAQTL
jgi:hypothetical protein